MSGAPKRQYLSAQEVLPKMRAESEFYLSRSEAQILVLAFAGGAFVTLGALFSLLLSNGVDAAGPQMLLQGLGFSAGFFMIILSRAALFTEANVLMPARALQTTPMGLPMAALRFWGLAALGNLLGAYVTGAVIGFAQVYPQGVTDMLSYTVAKKMAYMTDGGTALDWFRIVVSGMLGNGMIGMAAFFAIMANTLIGKYVPIFLVVSLFVAGNLQHSPANMGYFSLSMAMESNWGLGEG
jgi:formate/nitrite transporter FocA (FNT family)